MSAHICYPTELLPRPAVGGILSLFYNRNWNSEAQRESKLPRQSVEELRLRARSPWCKPSPPFGTRHRGDTCPQCLFYTPVRKERFRCSILTPSVLHTTQILPFPPKLILIVGRAGRQPFSSWGIVEFQAGYTGEQNVSSYWLKPGKSALFLLFWRFNPA